MKDIKIVITKLDNNTSIIISTLNDDDTRFTKLISQAQITEKDNKFISDLEDLINENYGG